MQEIVEPTSNPSSGVAPVEETHLQSFNRYFKTIQADTQDLIQQAQEIRYRVYCVEHQFENSAEHPDQREKDEFDGHAVHSLLIHRASGLAVGTVRLVLPRRDSPSRSFAIQHLIEGTEQYFPLLSTAEVSRFSISKQLRRRRTDGLYGDEATVSAATDPMPDRRSGPLMSLGLIQTLVRMSTQHRITHWTAVMEPKLLRFLATIGIHFEPIGGPVEYHGLRQPCYCEIGAVLARVKRERPSFWEVLTDGGILWPSTDNANSQRSRLSRQLVEPTT